MITKDAALKVQEPEWWRKEEPESSCQGEEQEQVKFFRVSRCCMLYVEKPSAWKSYLSDMKFWMIELKEPSWRGQEEC